MADIDLARERELNEYLEHIDDYECDDETCLDYTYDEQFEHDKDE